MDTVKKYQIHNLMGAPDGEYIRLSDLREGVVEIDGVLYVLRELDPVPGQVIGAKP